MQAPDDSYSPDEIERRRDAAPKKMLATLPKPHAKLKPKFKQHKAKKG